MHIYIYINFLFKENKIPDILFLNFVQDTIFAFNFIHYIYRYLSKSIH